MPMKDKSGFFLNTEFLCPWEVWMIISIILLLFVTLWGHDPRVTGMMKEKERGKKRKKREKERRKSNRK